MCILRRLRADEHGSVSLIFALAFPPLVFGVCAAVEISQAHAMRERLTLALSAASTAWRQSPPNDEAASIARRVFDGYVETFPSDIDAELNISIAEEKAGFTTHAVLKTPFLSAFGIEQLDLTSSRLESRDGQ